MIVVRVEFKRDFAKTVVSRAVGRLREIVRLERFDWIYKLFNRTENKEETLNETRKQVLTSSGSGSGSPNSSL